MISCLVLSCLYSLNKYMLERLDDTDIYLYLRSQVTKHLTHPNMLPLTDIGYR